MRSLSTFFLLLLSLFILSNFTIQPSHAHNFTHCVTYYRVTGEICYDFDNQIFESTPVAGETLVQLESHSSGKVSYELGFSIRNLKTNRIWEEGAETGNLRFRRKSNGNYTALYIDIPPNKTESIGTLKEETVEAQYIGERYLQLEGEFVRSHLFCYVVTTSPALHTLRYEWYFDWQTGILLRFYKAIEASFIRMQWIDYTFCNTTVNLTRGDVGNAFFVNQRANLYGGFGAGIVVVFAFYFLIQKKARRREIK